MAQIELSEALIEVIDRVSTYVANRDLKEACNELLRARELAQKSGLREDELHLTSLLASHLAAAGNHQAALKECRRAEKLDNHSGATRTATALQFLRMGHRETAAKILRRLVASDVLVPAEQHLALATLGQLTESDETVAAEYLKRAYAIAIEEGLPSHEWDQDLALTLALKGNQEGVAYLHQLQERALSSGDTATSDEVVRVLTKLV